MLRDPMTSLINSALMRLANRAETSDPSALVETFVDAGPSFTLLSGPNHQILYGRRGTGKTHALYYLADHVRKAGDQAVYLDLRQLGSTGGLYADATVPIPERATRLLVDTLLAINEDCIARSCRSKASTQTCSSRGSALWGG